MTIKHLLLHQIVATAKPNFIAAPNRELILLIILLPTVYERFGILYLYANPAYKAVSFRGMLHYYLLLYYDFYLNLEI